MWLQNKWIVSEVSVHIPGWLLPAVLIPHSLPKTSHLQSRLCPHYIHESLPNCLAWKFLLGRELCESWDIYGIVWVYKTNKIAMLSAWEVTRTLGITCRQCERTEKGWGAVTMETSGKDNQEEVSSRVTRGFLIFDFELYVVLLWKSLQMPWDFSQGSYKCRLNTLREKESFPEICHPSEKRIACMRWQDDP